MNEHINISAESEGLTGICLTQKERKESQAQEAACRGDVRRVWMAIELLKVPRVAEVGVGRETELKAWG